MIRITREMLRAWGACYDDHEIAALVPVEGVTPLEVLDAPIPAADRIWVLLHEEVLPASALRMRAVRWARGALEAERAAGREPASESWAACDVSERHALGEATDAELTAARRAAWDVAWSTFCAGADTTRSAAGAAAGAASAYDEDAAWDAASAISWACWDADGDGAWDAQLADVRQMLAGGEP